MVFLPFAESFCARNAAWSDDAYSRLSLRAATAAATAAKRTRIRISLVDTGVERFTFLRRYETTKTRTVLAVGRLHEQKGFDLLLHAWQPIEQACPEWSLRIVGEGHKRPELEAQIREQGLQRVTLTGCISDVKKEYTAASLFVLSSRYEPRPVPGEALGPRYCRQVKHEDNTSTPQRQSKLSMI